MCICAYVLPLPRVLALRPRRSGNVGSEQGDAARYLDWLRPGDIKKVPRTATTTMPPYVVVVTRDQGSPWPSIVARLCAFFHAARRQE